MKHRKNFLPTLLITIIFWLGLFYVILFVPPMTTAIIFTFYFLLYISLFLTLSLVFANSRRGLIFSTGLVILLFLQQINLINWLNIVLVIGIVTSLEIFLSR